MKAINVIGVFAVGVLVGRWLAEETERPCAPAHPGGLPFNPKSAWRKVDESDGIPVGTWSRDEVPDWVTM